MCCFFTSLLLFGPRLAILIWYLIQPIYVNLAFDNFIWGFLGWLFLPWTTLMYIIIYPGGIIGFDWLILGIGIFTDFASFHGSYRERSRVPYGDAIP
jgi:hypothetical protein